MKLNTGNQQRKTAKPKTYSLKRSVKSMSHQSGQLKEKKAEKTQITNATIKREYFNEDYMNMKNTVKGML